MSTVVGNEDGLQTSKSLASEWLRSLEVGTGGGRGTCGSSPFSVETFRHCDYISHSPQGKPGCNANGAGAMGAALMRAKPRIHTRLAPNHPLTARSNHRFGTYFSANHTIECLLKVCEKVCNSLHRFHTLCHLLQLGQHRRTLTGLHHSRSFW